jgi:hypothetical protein
MLLNHAAGVADPLRRISRACGHGAHFCPVPDIFASDYPYPSANRLDLGPQIGWNWGQAVMPFSQHQVDPALAEVMRTAFHKACDVLLLKCDKGDPMTDIHRKQDSRGSKGRRACR